MPVVALLAQGTHDKLLALGARLHGNGVVVHGEDAVEEDNDPDHGGRQQPARVEAEPGEVDGDLLAKVFSNVVQRLIFIPLPPRGPIVKEDLTDVELPGRSPFAGMLEWTLQ